MGFEDNNKFVTEPIGKYDNTQQQEDGPLQNFYKLACALPIIFIPFFWFKKK